MAIVKKTNLTKEELNQINGGGIAISGDYFLNCTVFSVINDKTGEVMGCFYDDFDAACDFADSHGTSCGYMSWDEVEKLQKQNKNKK
jgi:bacteriocin-like protein